MGILPFQNTQNTDTNKPVKGVTSSPGAKAHYFLNLILGTTIALLVILFFISPSFESGFKPTNLEKLDIGKPEIVEENLGKIETIGGAERDAIIAGFYERDLEKAATASGDFKRSEPYTNLYSALWAQHNSSKDPKILVQMEDIEKLIKREWPELYKQLLENGGFLR